MSLARRALDVRTNVTGLARSMLAVGTLLTIALNPMNALIAPLGPPRPLPAGLQPYLAHLSVFRLAGQGNLWLAKLVSIVILLLVVVGWRPRITALLHWWVSYSVVISLTILDGGDQITAILTVLLIPICLIDRRRWHWDAPVVEPSAWRLALGESTWWMIRLQVSLVYLGAALGKAAVREWTDGTAVYYWFTHPNFGAPQWLVPALRPMIESTWGVMLLTWGVIALELVLFAGLFASRSLWPKLFVAGVAFHLAIAVCAWTGELLFRDDRGFDLVLASSDGSVSRRLAWVCRRPRLAKRKIADAKKVTDAETKKERNMTRALRSSRVGVLAACVVALLLALEPALPASATGPVIDGKALYMAIFQARGPALPLIPEMNDNFRLEDCVSGDDLAQTVALFDDVIEKIDQRDPSFFSYFEKTLRSGDPFAIQMSIINAAGVTQQVLSDRLSGIRPTVRRDEGTLVRLRRSRGRIRSGGAA